MKLIGAKGVNLRKLSFIALILGILPGRVDALPDLMLAVQRAKLTIEYKRRAFTAGDCAFQEGCAFNTGGRKLLLLDAGIMNSGTSDLVIGNPYEQPNLFVWSACHGHFHMKGLATYRVLTLSGRQVARAYKQGFCLRDDRPKTLNAGPAKYTCDYQGISQGWQDTYDKSLDCQWVDITGVPPGAYNLEITVNPSRVFQESNYSNNRVLIRINVPRYVYY
jgi:hypothetical protein